MNNSPYLDLPLFPLADVLEAGVKALCGTSPRPVPDRPDYAPNGEDYRQLARRLRELARQTHWPYARQELVRLSAVYERRAAYLDRLAMP
jgi:hypothetical protein